MFMFSCQVDQYCYEEATTLLFSVYGLIGLFFSGWPGLSSSNVQCTYSNICRCLSESFS